MKSKVYPNIIFETNKNLLFIGSQLTQAQSLQILRSNDRNMKAYTKVVQKLLSEISILQQMLWVCRIPSSSTVRIYFSQPYQYPTAVCCHQPLFLQIEQDLSGHFSCSACLKKIAKFVYSQGEVGNDQQLFFQKQRQSKIRKQNFRQLFTSQRFRAKKLKTNGNCELKSCEKGSFIMEITMNYEQKIIQKFEQPPEDRLLELRSIINDIFS